MQRLIKLCEQILLITTNTKNISYRDRLYSARDSTF